MHSAASPAPVSLTTQATGIYTGSVKILPRTTCSLRDLHTNEHKKSIERNPRHSPTPPCEMLCSFKSFAEWLHILRFSYCVYLHPPPWFISRCRASTKRYMLPCHQCTDDTQLSISFPLDPDTAAGNLKQCLPEIGFWKKASWLLLNLDKAEIMLISRGKCFEDLVKFITAPSAEAIYLATILSSVQCKHQVRI